jgi:hypothetical protein
MLKNSQLLRSAVRRAEKWSAGGETAGTEPERNDRRRAADGSKRDYVFSFPSATSAREAVAERALVAAGDFCATHFIFPCAEIAQASHFLPANLCREKIIAVSDCAQDGAIHSTKCASIRSDKWGFSARKHLPVDTVAHGNKLQATAAAA